MHDNFFLIRLTSKTLWVLWLHTYVTFTNNFYLSHSPWGLHVHHLCKWDKKHWFVTFICLKQPLSKCRLYSLSDLKQAWVCKAFDATSSLHLLWSPPSIILWAIRAPIMMKRYCFQVFGFFYCNDLRLQKLKVMKKFHL